MNTKTVLKLNDLNKKFYSDLAISFSDSRNYFWKGWDLLIEQEAFSKLDGLSPIRVLDIGCGNGRFAKFLVEDGIQIDYLGVDFSEELLNEARTSIVEIDHDQSKFQFKEVDILNDLEDIQGKYDLVVLFGVLHHIPGSENRIELISHSKTLLKRGGLLVFTTWDFLEDEKVMKKIVDPQLADIDKRDLEENDHIFNWLREGSGFRYVHYVDYQEVSEILSNADLKKLGDFRADGKSGKLNHYYLAGL